MAGLGYHRIPGDSPGIIDAFQVSVTPVRELRAFVESCLSDPRLFAPAGEARRDMAWERVP